MHCGTAAVTNPRQIATQQVTGGNANSPPTSANDAELASVGCGQVRDHMQRETTIPAPTVLSRCSRSHATRDDDTSSNRFVTLLTTAGNAHLLVSLILFATALLSLLPSSLVVKTNHSIIGYRDESTLVKGFRPLAGNGNTTRSRWPSVVRTVSLSSTADHLALCPSTSSNYLFLDIAIFPFFKANVGSLYASR